MITPKKIIIISLFLIYPNITQSDYPKKMVIKTIISDLRATPYKAASHITLPAGPDDNFLQTSQLLLGEYVIAHEEHTNEFDETWLKVNALQQKHYDEQIGWQGYPGWILKEEALEVKSFPVYNVVVKNFLTPIFNFGHPHETLLNLGIQSNHEFLYEYKTKQELCKLSIGTRLEGHKIDNSKYWKITLPTYYANNLRTMENFILIHESNLYELYENWDISEQELRNNIVQTAKQFLGSDYSWGGRSAQNNQFHISSSDCSATVHLSYLAHGLQIPRMSHEQFLTAEEIVEGKNIQIGDLIFFSTIPEIRRADLHHIDHIMMYIGDDMLLESTMAGNKNIRVISCKDRLGYSIYDMKSGDISNTIDDKFYVYFAGYLHNPKLIMQLRTNAIRHNSRLANT